ncbi:MAG: hypothetical protein OXG04_14365 [Acidobacteria bacterium]|nr:hypothetical protein [Acidobacteriota bacterium]
MAVEDADWFGIDKLPLNSGLVTIIGARGSGKTALAEMIVTGCDGVPAVVWDGDAPPTSSFLMRARSHLGEGRVRLVWGGGDEASRYLDGRDSGGLTSFPRLRYLSQQFVEDLCSAHGPTDGLIAEVERVVFEAHPHESRDGALDFAELRKRRTQRFRQARAREAGAILQMSQRISEEIEKERLVGTVMNGPRDWRAAPPASPMVSRRKPARKAESSRLSDLLLLSPGPKRHRSLFPDGRGVSRRDGTTNGPDRNQAGTPATGSDSRPRSTIPRRKAGRSVSSRNDE